MKAGLVKLGGGYEDLGMQYQKVLDDIANLWGTVNFHAGPDGNPKIKHTKSELLRAEGSNAYGVTDYHRDTKVSDSHLAKNAMLNFKRLFFASYHELGHSSLYLNPETGNQDHHYKMRELKEITNF